MNKMPLSTTQKWLIGAAITCVISAAVIVVVLWQLGIGVFGSTVGTGLTAGTAIVTDYNPCDGNTAVTLESTIGLWPGNSAVNTANGYMSFSTKDDTLMCLVNPTGNPTDAVARQFKQGVSVNYPILDTGYAVQARSVAAIGTYSLAYVMIPGTGTLNFYTGSTTGGSQTNPGAYIRVDNFDPTQITSTQSLNSINNGDTAEYVFYRPSQLGSGSLYASWTNPTSTNSTVYTYPVNGSSVVNLPTSQFTVLGQTIKAMDIQGNFMAVGCPDNNLVYMYQFINNQWVAQGSALTIAITKFGNKVILSPDQLTLAVYGLNETAGTIYIYTRSSTTEAFVNLTAQVTTNDTNFGLSMMFIGKTPKILAGQSTGIPQIIDLQSPSTSTDWSAFSANSLESSNYTFLGGGTVSDTALTITYDTLAIFNANSPSLLKFTNCHQ